MIRTLGWWVAFSGLIYLYSINPRWVDHGGTGTLVGLSVFVLGYGLTTLMKRHEQRIPLRHKEPPTVRRTYFTVQGTGPFPIDMLRYDRCWPAEEQSTLILARSCAPRSCACDPDQPCAHESLWDCGRCWEIQLCTEGPGPTVDRWRSFGWAVTVMPR
jgi:hypothetical protein